MPTSALLLALGAAFVHALWNVLLARARDTRAATAVALLVAEVVFAVPTWAAWNVHAAADRRPRHRVRARDRVHDRRLHARRQARRHACRGAAVSRAVDARAAARL